ncbi:unnamed protein product [Arctogadus glacialis]
MRQVRFRSSGLRQDADRNAAPTSWSTSALRAPANIWSGDPGSPAVLVTTAHHHVSQTTAARVSKSHLMSQEALRRRSRYS